MGRANMMGGADSILRRKLTDGPRSFDTTAGAGLAWRQAFARAAFDHAQLELAAPPPDDRHCSLAELLEELPETALMVILEGPQDSCGLIALSSDTFAAVIEAQTIGRITSHAPAPRRPTRTDAALLAPLVDRALTLLEAALMTTADFSWAGGFRHASHVDEVRVLGLLLEDVPYRRLQLDLDISGGARNGKVVLALPADGRAEIPATVHHHNHHARESWRTGLQSAVGTAEVTLTAIIARQRLTLRKLMELAPGTVLTLDGASIDQVGIETGDGCVIARGRLGQHRGVRALKLHPAVGFGPDTAPRPPAAPAGPLPTDDNAVVGAALPDAAPRETVIPDIVADTASDSMTELPEIPISESA